MTQRSHDPLRPLRGHLAAKADDGLSRDPQAGQRKDRPLATLPESIAQNLLNLRSQHREQMLAVLAIGSLLVGLTYANSLSFASGVPLKQVLAAANYAYLKNSQ